MLAVLLLASAAYAADVTLSCTVDGNEVTISYVASADVNTPRGLGLDISLTNGATVGAVTELDTDYWVFPGSIDINDLNFPSGTAVGAGGTGSSSMTIEMGSLHYPTDPCASNPNAPGTSGDLLKFTVDANGASDTLVTIAGNAARGNVVLYDASEADVDYGSGCTVTFGGCATCRGDTNGDDWVTTSDVTKLLGSLRDARDDSGSPIYTGAFYYQCPVDGSYDCYDLNEDGWVTTSDVTKLLGNLREARDDSGSPIYTGAFYYQCP